MELKEILDEAWFDASRVECDAQHAIEKIQVKDTGVELHGSDPGRQYFSAVGRNVQFQLASRCLVLAYCRRDERLQPFLNGVRSLKLWLNKALTSSWRSSSLCRRPLARYLTRSKCALDMSISRRILLFSSSRK